jgi:arylsulfatase A-like enzyme
MRERAAGEKPWFLMISYGGPHMPYKAPDEYMELYDPEKLKLRKNVSGITDKGRQALAGYYAHATNLDMNIGCLLDELDELELTQGTLVMFTADHGDMHFSQGAQYKSKPWEESIGVPLVARMPGTIPRGREEDALFSSVDFFPTLCGLCGVEPPGDRDGTDLSHVLLGQPGTRRENVHLTIGKPDAEKAWRGVRTERHTYAWYPNSDEGYVLYDNEADPYQMNNLIDDEKHAPLRERLHALTLSNLRAAGDPLGSS